MQSNILVCYDNDSIITDCTGLNGFIDATKYSANNGGNSMQNLQNFLMIRILSKEIKIAPRTRIDAVSNVQVVNV